MARRRKITLELFPHERAALLRWNFTPEIRSQLEAVSSSEEVESITVLGYEVMWLMSDLNHAIVKKGCRDEDVIELAERLEYVHESDDGGLEIWFDIEW